ncbi:MAG: hypothetical protein AABY22_35845 [Nanoarchaeota archaeon]
MKKEDIFKIIIVFLLAIIIIFGFIFYKTNIQDNSNRDVICGDERCMLNFENATSCPIDCGVPEFEYSNKQLISREGGR